MKSSLIIQDLNYLEEAQDSDALVAGNAHAVTGTIAKTGTGYAFADAVALALGQFTNTNTQTQARTIFYPRFILSESDARAIAFAKSKNQIASSSSYTTSTTLSFTSSDIFTNLIE